MCSAVSLQESITRSSSSKFRPVLIGYVRLILIFLSGPMRNTDRTVALSAAVLPSEESPTAAGNMSYILATLRLSSAMMGKFSGVPARSSMSEAQRWWSSTLSTLRPITLQFRFSNSPLTLATCPSSVAQTGVKSFGCEKSIAQPSPIHSWKLTVPSLVFAVKSGAVSLMRSAIISPLSSRISAIYILLWQPLGQLCDSRMKL